DFTPDPFSPLPAGAFSVGTGPDSVAVGNFNGKVGIVTANSGSNTVSVLLGNGHGELTTDTFSLPPPGAVSVGAGTRSGAGGVVEMLKGKVGMVTAKAGSNRVSVLLGNGHGDFTTDPFSLPGPPVGTFAVGTRPDSVAVGDFNGNVGIVTANSGDNTVSVLLG